MIVLYWRKTKSSVHIEIQQVELNNMKQLYHLHLSRWNLNRTWWSSIIQLQKILQESQIMRDQTWISMMIKIMSRIWKSIMQDDWNIKVNLVSWLTRLNKLMTKISLTVTKHLHEEDRWQNYAWLFLHNFNHVESQSCIHLQRMNTSLFLYQTFKIFVMFKMKMFMRKEFNVDNMSLEKINMNVSKIKNEAC